MKIKKLMPVLLATSTIATTTGFVTSCGSVVKPNIEITDELIENGWTRQFDTEFPEGQISNPQEGIRWYLGQQHVKSILRDDILRDIFPGTQTNSNEDGGNFEGKFGLQIDSANSETNRLSFSMAIEGDANEITRDWPFPFYVDGSVKFTATIKDVRVATKHWSKDAYNHWVMYWDYLDKDGYLDINALLNDPVDWSMDFNVDVDVDYKYNILGEETGEIVLQNEKFEIKKDYQEKYPEMETIITVLLSFFIPRTNKNLEYMQNIKVQ